VGVSVSKNFSAISNIRKPRLVLKCSQNPALQLNKVRFSFVFGFFYFEVYRIKHGKSVAKKIRVGGRALTKFYSFCANRRNYLVLHPILSDVGLLFSINDKKNVYKKIVNCSLSFVLFLELTHTEGNIEKRMSDAHLIDTHEHKKPFLGSKT